MVEITPWFYPTDFLDRYNITDSTLDNISFLYYRIKISLENNNCYCSVELNHMTCPTSPSPTIPHCSALISPNEMIFILMEYLHKISLLMQCLSIDWYRIIKKLEVKVICVIQLSVYIWFPYGTRPDSSTHPHSSLEEAGKSYKYCCTFCFRKH